MKALSRITCIERLKVPEEPYRGFMDQVYKTPSKKMELYHEKLAEDNQALPTFEEAGEATSHNPLKKKYPLQFSQAHTKYRVHSQFTNAKWINQIDPGPRLEMNPKDAKSRDLKTGDIVEVFNDRGSFKANCKLTEALRPGQIDCMKAGGPSIWKAEIFKMSQMTN